MLVCIGLHNFIVLVLNLSSEYINEMYGAECPLPRPFLVLQDNLFSSLFLYVVFGIIDL